jgi:phosphoribosyl 1,2-cyclic phosphate phosphodiesterase
MPTRSRRLLRARFGYCFASPPGSDYPPILMEHRLTVGEGATITGKGGPLEALPFRLVHGNIDALGFRFGDLAYTPDVSAIPTESEPALDGLDTWIIDALRYAPHPSHFSLSDALSAIARFKPRRAILTNLHSDLDFATVTAELPPGVEAAFDGMVIEAT